MTALDRLIPHPRLHELDEVELAASPTKVWECVRHGELVRSRLARALFSLRTLPARLAGREREETTLRVDELVSSEARPGFQILADDPPREVAVGAIGKVWHLDIPFVHVDDADAFAAFARPDYIKVAWALRVEPGGAHAARLVMELRVDATDDAAWAKFRPYFGVIGPFSRWIRRSLLAAFARELGAPGDTRPDWRDIVDGLRGATRMLADFVTPSDRPTRSHWGLDTRDAVRVYPGDDRVRSPRWGWTHAVEIEAPAERVWPWIAQVGVGRGGFYSYAFLENLAGCHLRNANTIHPEWEVEAGDELVLHPDVPPLRIVELVPGQHFVAFAEAEPAPGARSSAWVQASWLFLVEPLGSERCRFISRYRIATSNDLWTRTTFGPALVEPIGFEMDRRMLLGVKERAERDRRGHPA